MSEFRYDPLLNDWVIIAAKRQNRPNIANVECAFCPGRGKVPEEGYGVMRYPNDFPSMSVEAQTPASVSGMFVNKPAYGRCEVVLYSDRHDAKLRDMSDEKMFELVKLWREIYRQYSEDEKIKYTFIFENRGREVGVTMIHPHGQVYGYGFMPKRISEVMTNLKAYRGERSGCLICDMLKSEKNEGSRVVFSDEYFTAYVPYYSRYPYGVMIVSNAHISSLDEMDDDMLVSLGSCVRNTAGMYDNLFDKEFPYMMCMYNAPVHEVGAKELWHFHIEYYPPLRNADTQKYNASSETGCNAHCNPTLPEEKAAELRDAFIKYTNTAKNEG